MPFKYKRTCPICNRPNQINLSTHLYRVHGISKENRKEWLTKAVITPTHHPYVSRDRLLIGSKQKKRLPRWQGPSVLRHKKAVSGQQYPDFKFRHKFSLLVVGPTQCGKTVLVQQLLERDHIQYEQPHLPRKIYWFYGQQQPIYKEMKRKLGKDIRFCEGLPKFEDDLGDLDPHYNNICVLDDLMDLAVDSPIISKLFTQGRHRNTSTILMLQNAFPKGKQNTSISRNAQYIALFRSPADRRQVGMIADRIFDQSKPAFMELYNRVTSQPYQYVLIDNKPDTPGEKQVITNVFGSCQYFPGINGKNEVKGQMMEVNGNDFGKEENRITNSDEDFNKDVLKMNDPCGPIVLNLKAKDFDAIYERFRFCDRSYNPNPGWTIWRLIELKEDDVKYGMVGYYPCVLKDSQNNKAYWCLSKHYVYKDMRYNAFKPLLYYKE